MVGVDDLMDSACEQDDPEQVFTKLADHGNGNGGSVDAELDTRSKGCCISLCFEHTKYFFGDGGSLTFAEHPLHQANRSPQLSYLLGRGSL